MDTGEKFLIGGTAAIAAVALLFPKRSMAYSTEMTPDDAGPPMGPEAAASSTGTGVEANRAKAAASRAAGKTGGQQGKMSADRKAKLCGTKRAELKQLIASAAYQTAKAALASGTKIQDLPEDQKATIRKMMLASGIIRQCSPGALKPKGKGKGKKPTGQAKSILNKLKGKAGGLLDQAKGKGADWLKGKAGGASDWLKDKAGGGKGKDDGAAQPDADQSPPAAEEEPGAAETAPASEGSDASAPNVEGWEGWGYTDSFDLSEHVEYGD